MNINNVTGVHYNVWIDYSNNPRFPDLRLHTTWTEDELLQFYKIFHFQKTRVLKLINHKSPKYTRIKKGDWIIEKVIPK